MHALLFLLFYHNTVLLIDEIICSECCFPTLTLLSFDFLICILSFIFLIFTFLPFFPLIGSKTVDRVKKIKRVRLALKVGTRIQLKISNSLSVCTSGVFTNVFSVN